MCNQSGQSNQIEPQGRIEKLTIPSVRATMNQQLESVDVRGVPEQRFAVPSSNIVGSLNRYICRWIGDGNGQVLR